MLQNHLEGLLLSPAPHPPLRVSDSVDLAWFSRNGISNKLPSDAEAVALGSQFENPLLSVCFQEPKL